MRSIFSLLFIAVTLSALSQGFPGAGGGISMPQGNGTQPPPRQLPPKIKEPMDWRPKYLKFSYDIVPPFRAIAINGQKSQEYQALLSVDKYFLAIEAGNANFTRNHSVLTDTTNWGYSYKNSGNFFRVGTDVNLIKNNQNGGSFTLGFRYGRSTFKDQLDYNQELGFGQLTYTDSNSKVISQWLELVAGLNVEIWKQLHMGFTVRYKVQRGDRGIGTLKPFDIPGFGLYRNFNTVGFNYYFGWAIPLRKLEEPPTAN